MSFIVIRGDCLSTLPLLEENSVDSIVTDPPYELGLLGKSWDSTGIAFSSEMWKKALRVLKPGGHMLVFGGSRTYHRMAVAIEDAGFEIRDQIMWVYGSGFPKSLNISLALEKNKESSVDWKGWGTALKPAHEPIVLARKPLQGRVIDNILKWGVGGINIDESRVPGEPVPLNKTEIWSGFGAKIEPDYIKETNNKGRFPANFIHDGDDEVVELFPKSKGVGSASRFFYCPKASTRDRNDGLDGFEEKRPDERTETGMGTFVEKGVAKQANHHPTVKPTELMRYLVKLITPVGGTVLDPFVGSGSTGKAAVIDKFNFIGIEENIEYANIAEARIKNEENK